MEVPGCKKEGAHGLHISLADTKFCKNVKMIAMHVNTGDWTDESPKFKLRVSVNDEAFETLTLPHTTIGHIPQPLSRTFNTFLDVESKSDSQGCRKLIVCSPSGTKLVLHAATLFY